MKRLLGLLGASGAAAVAAPFYWLDAAYDSRVVATLTNAQAIPLHDRVVDITVPAGVDANSLRAIEVTALGSADRAYDWRYPITLNHVWWLPASLSGTTATVKLLGKWAAGETRYVALYWASGGGIAAPSFTHLDGIVQAWTLTPTVGTTGDSYVAVVTSNGVTQTATYVQLVGDTTATLLTTGIKGAINALGFGTIATGTTSVTITQPSKLDGTFAVANTGSTQPAKVVVARPTFFGVGRVGPDTTQFSATSFFLGLPFANPVSGGLTRPGFGRATNHVAARMGAYSVNGVGAQTPSSANVLTLVNDGPRLRMTGSLNWTQPQWTVTYSATIENKIVSGRKSDVYPDNGAATLPKLAEVVRLTMVWTCATAYTPSAVLNTATTLGTHELLAVACTASVFTSNVTENGAASPQTSGAQTQNAVPNFYADASTGAITAYASTDTTALTALDPTAYIFGAHGNSLGAAMKIESVAFANFGSQSPEAKVTTQGNAFAVLHLRNLVTTSQIPVGATITVNATIVSGFTNSATTVGDNLLPDEAVTLIRGVLGTTPTVAVAAAERSAAGGLAATMALAGTRAVAGVNQFLDNAVSRTTVAHNYGYQYQVKTAAVGQPDDDDGAYGAAFALSGLCMRYLRTHDPALIAPMETIVQYFLDLEAAAVATYSSWWSGSVPYWFWASSTSSGSAFTAEGGINGGDNATDPAIVGAPKTITYTRGTVRARTSPDQIHITAGALYHYLYLLRNESAITANTTLVTNAKSYVSRMATFEAAHIVADSRICGNLDKIVNGLTPLRANGITDTKYNNGAGTTLANPFWGLDAAQNFYGWNVNNTDNVVINPNSNIAMDDFFRALLAPASTVAGTLRYLRGQAMDFAASDFSKHDAGLVTTGWNTAYSTTVFPAYPAGWMGRANVGNLYRYNVAHAPLKHYLEFPVAGAGHRDAIGGKSAQRLAVLCLAYLLGGAYDVPTEQNGVTTTGTVALATEIDALANTLANYGIEPTTQAQRMSVPGWFGEPSAAYDPQLADSAMTGYWLYAVELWTLVKAGASYATYYPIGGF